MLCCLLGLHVGDKREILVPEWVAHRAGCDAGGECLEERAGGELQAYDHAAVACHDTACDVLVKGCVLDMPVKGVNASS